MAFLDPRGIFPHVKPKTYHLTFTVYHGLGNPPFMSLKSEPGMPARAEKLLCQMLDCPVAGRKNGKSNKPDRSVAVRFVKKHRP